MWLVMYFHLIPENYWPKNVNTFKKNLNPGFSFSQENPVKMSTEIPRNFSKQFRGISCNPFRGISHNPIQGISHNPIQGISCNQFQGISCYQFWRIWDQFRRISQDFPRNQSQKLVLEKFLGNSSKKVTKTGDLMLLGQ